MKVHCAHDELKDLDLLVPHPKNPNRHPDKQIKYLAKIMSHQGWRHPITVSKRSGFIVAGHGRLLAAKKNGWESAPVDYQDFESEADEYAHLIADNKIAELAEHDDSMMIETIRADFPDIDLELLGLPDFELPIEPDPARDEIEDDVPTDVETRVKPGDVWRLGEHRLMCGDSTNIQHVEKLMDGERADLLYTDPPYGIDIVAKEGTIGGGNLCKAGVYKQIIGDQTTDAAQDSYELATSMEIPVLCIWGGNYFTHFLPPRMGWIVWDKRGDMPSDNFSDCELAWTNLDKAARCYKQIWAGMIKQGESGKRVHPTQKPIALAEYCFELLIPKSKNVLDLFGGSGSTLIACEKTKRKCFMMELDPHYCDVILARWEKYTGQTAERIEESPNG